MNEIDLKQYKVKLRESKTIKKGNIYIAGNRFDMPLQLAVCLGFKDTNEPYFYVFGALKGCFTKDRNSIVAWMDTDYMNAILSSIIKYEFTQSADIKSFGHSFHIYDIGLGQISVDVDLWYLKQKMILPQLPALKSTQKELKPLGKKDLKVGGVYITRTIYGININVYMGYSDNYFNFYSLSEYSVSMILNQTASFSNNSITSTKTKPKFYALEDIKDILPQNKVESCKALIKLISEDINVLYR